MSDWHPFDEGRSIGQRGSEDGSILLDEEHPLGSRITLERGGYGPFSITCGINGWMVHTRFFADEAEARNAFEEMKAGLVNILNIIPLASETDAAKEDAVSEALVDFIERFP
ncbi:MAG: hypothetical protein JOZ02_10290 [Acidobacteria bacterium]|nr:hypothetical protein [Acidobacteriota bacterium]